MNRREARELTFKLTYEYVMTGEFNTDTRDELLENSAEDCKAFVNAAVAGIAEHKDAIKSVIIKYAKGYEYDRIYKVDLAILTVACYELMYTDVPRAVVANEAVEIAKIYSDVKSHSFINGILASVIREDGENG